MDLSLIVKQPYDHMTLASARLKVGYLDSVVLVQKESEQSLVTILPSSIRRSDY